MSIPGTVRVKISSEAAEMALTPVVGQEMPMEELLGRMLAVAGKDPHRVAEILARGSLVSGASRFRCEPIQAGDDEVRASLARFPDPDPSRTFDPSRCYEATLLCGIRPVVLERSAAEKRRLLRSRSFWAELMSVAAERTEYVEYSYRESADVYRRKFDTTEAERLRDAARLLAYSGLERQIRSAGVREARLLVRR